MILAGPGGMSVRRCHMRSTARPPDHWQEDRRDGLSSGNGEIKAVLLDASEAGAGPLRAFRLTRVCVTASHRMNIPSPRRER